MSPWQTPFVTVNCFETAFLYIRPISTTNSVLNPIICKETCIHNEFSLCFTLHKYIAVFKNLTPMQADRWLLN